METIINDKDEYKVIGVYLGGVNLLRQDEDFGYYEDEGLSHMRH